MMAGRPVPCEGMEEERGGLVLTPLHIAWKREGMDYLLLRHILKELCLEYQNGIRPIIDITADVKDASHLIDIGITCTDHRFGLSKSTPQTATRYLLANIVQGSNTYQIPYDVIP